MKRTETYRRPNHCAQNQSAWGEEALCQTGSLEAVPQAVCRVGAGAVCFSVSFLCVFLFA